MSNLVFVTKEGRHRPAFFSNAQELRNPGSNVGLAVDPVPVPDPEHQDFELLLLNVADHAVVADSVFPEPPKHRPMQRLANTTRVIKLRQAFG